MSTSRLSLRSVLLLTIGALTLLIAMMSVREVLMDWQRVKTIRSLKTATAVSQHFFNSIEALSREREITLALLHAPVNSENLQTELLHNRDRADTELRRIVRALQSQELPLLPPETDELQGRLIELKKQRAELDAIAASPPAARNPARINRSSEDATALIAYITDIWMGYTRHFTTVDSVITQRWMFQHFLGLIIGYSGRERALIGQLLVTEQPISAEEQRNLLQWRGVVDHGWDLCARLAERARLTPAITPYLNDARSHYLTVYDMVEELFYRPGTITSGAYPIGIELWLEVARGSTDSLNALKNAALDQTAQYVALLEHRAERSMLLHTIVLLVALILCFYSFWIVNRRVMGPIRDMIAALLATAEGKSGTHISPLAMRSDEIGKLAQVLHALQKNSERIRRYADALERSNKELDDFAYIASHDLKEPLRGIHNHSRFLLEDNADKLDPQSNDRLHRLLYLSQRMEKLVNDLLYFSRLGRQELAVQPTDLNLVVRDIESLSEDFLKERNGRILIPQPLPTVVCDKPRITEALRNLVTNALKYNDKPIKVIEIGHVPFRVDPKGVRHQNVFYLKDNGIGIALEFHEEVFRIFKRLQSSNAEDGTGAGLTFVKKIIERHEGTIWLESQPGQGTVFYFTLGGSDVQISE